MVKNAGSYPETTVSKQGEDFTKNWKSKNGTSQYDGYCLQRLKKRKTGRSYLPSVNNCYSMLEGKGGESFTVANLRYSSHD